MAVDLTDKYCGNKEHRSDKGDFINPNYAFLQTEFDNYYILALQGGTRSGKTFAVIMFIWWLIENFKGLKISIYKETMPTLLDSVWADFIEVGTELVGLYNEDNMHKTRFTYTHNGNEVHFRALDKEGKAKGIKNDFIYLNEANEIPWPLVAQLFRRNEGRVMLDYNPNDVDSWIYSKVLTRDTCALIKTTYKDNLPNLKPFQLEEIEWMRVNEPEEYKVYGEGERRERKGQIYKTWNKIGDLEYDWRNADVWILDFGATIDPTVITRGKYEPKKIIIKELLYSQDVRIHHLPIHLFVFGFKPDSHTLIADAKGMGAKIVKELREGFNYNIPQIKETINEILGTISQDAAVPYLRLIEDNEMLVLLKKYMATATTNVIRAMQGKGAIVGGIEKVKTFEVFVSDSSTNVWSKEYPNYVWKVTRNGDMTGEPVDKDNHFMDCIRYGALGYGRQHSYK